MDNKDLPTGITLDSSSRPPRPTDYMPHYYRFAAGLSPTFRETNHRFFKNDPLGCTWYELLYEMEKIEQLQKAKNNKLILPQKSIETVRKGAEILAGLWTYGPIYQHPEFQHTTSISPPLDASYNQEVTDAFAPFKSRFTSMLAQKRLTKDQIIRKLLDEFDKEEMANWPERGYEWASRATDHQAGKTIILSKYNSKNLESA